MNRWIRVVSTMVLSSALAVAAPASLLPSASALILPPPSVAFGDVPINTPLQKPVHLIMDPGFTFQDAGFLDPTQDQLTVDPNNCTIGATDCTLLVKYNPDSFTTVSDSLLVIECLAFTISCRETLIPVTGRGVSVQSVTPTSLDFNDVAVGSAFTKSVTVTPDAGFEVGNPQVLPTSAPFTTDAGTCASVPRQNPCQPNISFAPVALGVATATVRVYECEPPVSGEIQQCAFADITVTGNGVAPLVITTATLPTAAVNVAYPATPLQATGGTGTQTWAVTSGSLPAGLTLSAAGVISGTPTALGTSNLTVKAIDTGSPPQVATKALSISIGASSADLAVSAAGTPNPVGSNKPLTFTITVKNFGPQIANGVVLSNVLPSASKFASISAIGATCNTPPVGSTGTITCSLGNLASNGTQTVQINVTVAAKKDSVSNTANVSTGPATSDLLSANNNATVLVRVK